MLNIQVTGKGAHAAKPHDGIDTTVVASHIVIALQTIASRVADPLDNLVVSITSFETESKAFNVIPEHVELRGTVRTLSPSVRDMAEEQISRIAENTAAAFGATAKVTYDRNYPVTVNHEKETVFMADVARSLVGDANVDDNMVPTMGGEDFAFMLESRPGAPTSCAATATAPWSTTPNTTLTTKPSRWAVRSGPISLNKACRPPDP